MFCHSTRDERLRADCARGVLEGLAPDGGLYVPEEIPQVDARAWVNLPFLPLAAQVISAILPGISSMESLVERAYTGKFSSPEVTPTVKAGPFTVLELFHGPTSAFKDVALCMLPQLLTAAKAQKGMKEDILILTATSGDTGKAALEGFRDVPGVKICVFYPEGGVSQVQEAQMVTQEGKNVFVFGVKGNFDDAQSGVKHIFAAADHRRLSTANSMNLGRLAPQITYYFKAYGDLLKGGEIAWGQKVNFSVPTGNFGDILAGYLAKEMGLPVGTLICASNENNVLTDFLATGTYDRRRPLHKTISPSMDILISSNLERLLYFVSRDTSLVKDLMEKLNQEGHYTLPESLMAKIQSQFWGGWCSDEKGKQVISRVYGDYGYLCDPHTAAGWAAAEEYRGKTGDENPLVVLSTASPYKFPEAVLSALGEAAPKDGFAALAQLHKKTAVPVPRNLLGLEQKPRLHTRVIGKDEMLPTVLGL